jgi:hypothetical protein
LREIEKIICHCSASDKESHDNVNVIREWHLSRGWDDIGYHFVIESNGNLSIGRPIGVIGAHCYGENKNSIGICLTGKEVFTEFQFKTLKKLCFNLCEIFKIHEADIYPHWYFNKKKSCPVYGLGEVREHVRERREARDKRD